MRLKCCHAKQLICWNVFFNLLDIEFPCELETALLTSHVFLFGSYPTFVRTVRAVVVNKESSQERSTSVKRLEP